MSGYGEAGAIGGRVAGGVVGGAIGSFLGPLGTLAGRAIGSRLGGMAGRAAAEAVASAMTDANEDAEEMSDEDASTSCAECGEIDCFTPPDGADPEEFRRQLKEQQDAINEMSPDEILGNMERYANEGRGAGDAAARRAARDAYRTRETRNRTTELRRQGLSRPDAEAQAGQEVAEAMRSLDALHAPDGIAGGDGTISGLGNRSVNRSIGGQWKNGRADQLKDIAEQSQREGMEKMDVELDICPEDGEAGSGGTESGAGSGDGDGSGQGDTPMV
ncbi:polymorphic toxin type 15 domain-containing protein [Tropicimonas sp. IMCC34011]|uniref:polymorphic toxin type 15 domain-containing protein n=1 Tax=Tropicimonas sp. IMCC34011 TaxID=2248759 RepID=UPI000E21CC78|nr:polymorphic toxin type 15 domain-containing protein [Tropicimonas sp. IMCC34011]